MAETRVRVWAVEVMSGDVVGEVPVSDGRWSTALTGSTCEATVPLGHLRTRDGSAPDLAAVDRVLGQVTPGRRCLVATAGEQTLGEWIIMRRSAVSSDGQVQLQGIAWDAYPDMRTILRTVRAEGLDQLMIAQELLADAYTGGGQNIQITIPTPSPSGVHRDVEYRFRQAYYGRALRDISDTEDGFEWLVDSQMQWDNGAPTRVERTVRWGYPVLASTAPTGLQVTHDGPGTHSGTCVRYAQGDDYARVRTLAAVIGAGEGRRRVLASEPVGPRDFSYLASNQFFSLPDARSEAQAAAYARSRLAAPPQGMVEPPEATLLVERLPSWPRVGQRLPVRVEPTLTMPAGRVGVLRVGEVAWSAQAGHAPTVTVAGVEED